MEKDNKEIFKGSKKNSIFQNDFVRYLIISALSFVIAIIFITHNIEKERQKVFNDMRVKIKSEVENELYSELLSKFEVSVRSDLKKEYRDFVKLELKDSLREDIFRNLKHQIDNEGTDLFYELFESIEYKHNGENVHHCEVVVKNLEKVFQEELEGLFKQIFSDDKDKKGVLLVFSEDPEKNGYRPDYRLEQGLNDQILIIQEGKHKEFANNSLIY